MLKCFKCFSKKNYVLLGKKVEVCLSFITFFNSFEEADGSGDDGGTLKGWQQGPSRSEHLPSLSELELVSPSSLLVF